MGCILCTGRFHLCKNPETQSLLKGLFFPRLPRLRAKSPAKSLSRLLVAPYPSCASDSKNSTNLNSSSWLKSVSLVTVPLIRPDTLSARVARGTQNCAAALRSDNPFWTASTARTSASFLYTLY
ncbi:hypothetical protein DPMN_105726 [Dreissena polymorpha]|uniref:Uncharacterized protein n=1 Tax=Dreissena polymorpha TaxID=45954 RepID=A0A9D4QI03_DREPO|nr:hypothetical protein DPMN_105726 [Dreissena polymorpha]